MKETEIIKKISEKKKLPKEVKNKMMSEILDCTFSAIIVYTYFIFLKLGMKNIHQDIYITDLKVFQMSLVILAIIFFEKAYNNKDAKNLYRGIEILILAIITMLLQYFNLYLTPRYAIMIPIFAIIYNIYFCLKALATVYKMKSKHISELSDIKEIVKNKKSKKPTR